MNDFEKEFPHLADEVKSKKAPKADMTIRPGDELCFKAGDEKANIFIIQETTAKRAVGILMDEANTRVTIELGGSYKMDGDYVPPELRVMKRLTEMRDAVKVEKGSWASGFRRVETPITTVILVNTEDYSYVGLDGKTQQFTHPIAIKHFDNMADAVAWVLSPSVENFKILTNEMRDLLPLTKVYEHLTELTALRTKLKDPYLEIERLKQFKENVLRAVRKEDRGAE